MIRHAPAFQRHVPLVITIAACLALLTLLRTQPTSIAQEEGETPATEDQQVFEASNEEAPEARSEHDIRQAFDRRISLDFEDTPLADVLTYLRDLLNVQIISKDPMLSEAGLTTDVPVTLHLENVRAELALELLLDSIGSDLVYYTRDNLIIITTKEDLARTLVTRVYDVRDIAEASATTVQMPPIMPSGSGMPGGMIPGGMAPAMSGSTSMMGGGGMMGMGGMSGMPGSSDAGMSSGMAMPMGPSGMMGSGMGTAMGGTAMGGGVMPGGAMSGGNPGDSSQPQAGQSTLSVILEDVIEPSSWETSGGPGVIRGLEGILIVRQTERVHTQIEDLLKDMREAYGISSTQ